MGKRLVILTMVILSLSLSSCKNSSDSKNESASLTNNSKAITSTTTGTTTKNTTSTKATTTTTKKHTTTTTKKTTTKKTTTTTTTTTQKTTTTTTTTTTHKPTTTTIDYSFKINELKQQNTLLQNEINEYQRQIEEDKIDIELFEIYRTDAENDVDEAKQQLENAQKKKIRVYTDSGWVEEADSQAVKEAEDNLATYQSILSLYEECIQSCNSDIEYYNKCIATNQSQIDNNNILISDYQNR